MSGFKGHSQLWERADLDTSFRTLKKVHLNLSIFAVFRLLPTWLKSVCIVSLWSFSSPEAALLLVSTKDRDLWPGPTPVVHDSRTSCYSAHAHSQVWQIWLVLVSICCVYKAIQNRNVVGPGPEVAILTADQKERGLWRRECCDMQKLAMKLYLMDMCASWVCSFNSQTWRQNVLLMSLWSVMFCFVIRSAIR